MSNHAELARELFMQGYNCAQAVVCAFCDVTGLEIDAAARMASSFGGGLGRLREVCGTVSGAALVLGIVRGYADPEDYAAKKAHYALVQDFARRFREANGNIVCRELLKGIGATEGGAPEARTVAYYNKRPCPNLAYCAAEILDEMLKDG
ncbi:MAG: C_GCAxxG_C_C family protein [Clostridia bacterium]|nr:C_GCAxxG_C_C family protein [Clostridia bacterium]